jgi:HAD superfamily hydrolase (TIGR01549 family)
MQGLFYFKRLFSKIIGIKKNGLLNKNSGKICAIIWDYDGTLVDSRQKNLNVTRKIVSKILKDDPTEIHTLSSLENYHQAHIKATNWREFYKDSFGLTEEQTDDAGRMWTGYQLGDQTSIPLINGVEEAIISLSNYPQGIVSQNSRENIIQYLKQNNLHSYFKSIIGYEEVDLNKQKPHPEGLMRCIEKLTDFKPGVVIYIGDHETDAQCALNAKDILSEKSPDTKIISLGAFYGFDIDTSGWSVLPDYPVQNAADIKNIVSSFNGETG